MARGKVPSAGRARRGGPRSGGALASRRAGSEVVLEVEVEAQAVARAAVRAVDTHVLALPVDGVEARAHAVVPVDHGADVAGLVEALGRVREPRGVHRQILVGGI